MFDFILSYFWSRNKKWGLKVWWVLVSFGYSKQCYCSSNIHFRNLCSTELKKYKSEKTKNLEWIIRNMSYYKQTPADSDPVCSIKLNKTEIQNLKHQCLNYCIKTGLTIAKLYPPSLKHSLQPRYQLLKKIKIPELNVTINKPSTILQLRS